MLPGDGLSSKTARKVSSICSQSGKATDEITTADRKSLPASEILGKVEPQNVKLVRK